MRRVGERHFLLIVMLIAVFLIPQFAFGQEGVPEVAPAEDYNRSFTAPENYGSLVEDGSCGSDARWSYYSSGVLVIHGAGKLDFDGNTNSPWSSKYGKSIKVVIVEEPITYICNFAFSKMPNCRAILFKGPQTPGYQKFFGQYALSGLDQKKCSIYYTPGDDTWRNGVLGYKQPRPWVSAMFDADWTNVESLGVCGDNSCWGLFSDGSLKIIGDGEVSESIYPEDKSLANELVVNQGISGFAEGVRLGADNLVVATLSDSVSYISGNLFRGKKLLERVALSPNIIEIPNSAFSGCSALADFVFPQRCQRIGESAFYKCSSLSEVELPTNLMEIGSHAFSDCGSLKSLVFNSRLSVIRDHAFSRCSSLAVQSLPANLSRIEDFAFTDCQSIEKLVVPESVQFIGVGALGFTVDRIDFLGSIPEFSAAIPSGSTEFIATHRHDDASWDVAEKYGFCSSAKWYTGTADDFLYLHRIA